MLIASVLIYQQTAAKTVTLSLDGDILVLSTKAKSVGELLEEQGLHVRRSDLLQPTQDASVEDGLEVSLKRAIPVFIAADGLTRLAYTTRETVEDVLREAEIYLSLSDRVEPGLEAELFYGATIKITRITTALVHEEVAIPFVTDKKNDSGMAVGQRKVVIEGRTGSRLETYRVVLADNIEESRALVEEKIITPPVDSVVAVGTGLPAPIITASSRSGQTGNVMEGEASWYGYGDGFQGSKTASGEVFDKNELTAAHPTLPFGTMVRVTYLKTGHSVEVRINDRGPFDKKRIIDLSMAAAEAIGLRPAGIGTVRIEVLE